MEVGDEIIGSACGFEQKGSNGDGPASLYTIVSSHLASAAALDHSNPLESKANLFSNLVQSTPVHANPSMFDGFHWPYIEKKVPRAGSIY